MFSPSHPRADSRGYVLEHILIWEQETGISVPQNCCVHHLNGNKADNRISNLCLMKQSAHTVFHHLGSHRNEETKKILSQKAKERFSDKRDHPFYKDVDVSEMVKMRESGKKVSEICAQFGICKRTYYDKMEDYRNGIK